jgi:hypothetical protein
MACPLQRYGRARGYEARINERGKEHLWLEERWINKLRTLRGDRAKATPTRSLRMAAAERGWWRPEYGLK